MASAVPSPTVSPPAPASGDLSLRAPFPQLCLVLLSLPGPFAALLPLGMAPLFITLGVLGGGLVLARRRRWPVLPPAVVAPLAAFVLLGTVSIAWTPVARDGTAQAITFLYVLLPAFLLFDALARLSDPERQRLEKVFVAGMAVGLGFYLVEVAFDQPLYRLAKRIDGDKVADIRNLNRAAAILTVLVWPLALALRGRLGAAAAWAVLLGYLALTLFASSASAVAGMLAGVLVLALAQWRTVAARRLVAGLLVAGFLLAVPMALGLHRLGLAQREDLLPFSFRHRVEIWNIAAERVLEHPVLGWGLDSSRHIPNEGAHTDFSDVVRGGNILPLHPHNLFLQALLELGAVGAGLLLWFGLALLGAIGRLAAWAQPYTLALFMASLTVAAFAYGAWQTWWLCGLLVATTMVLIGGSVRTSAPGSRVQRP